MSTTKLVAILAITIGLVVLGILNLRIVWVFRRSPTMEGMGRYFRWRPG